MIFCDLDGVFADFTAAACEVHGRPNDVSSWNFYEDWGITKEEFWEPINELGDTFYEDIVKPLPWAESLRDAVLAADRDVAVLTSCDQNVEGIPGKIRWIKRLFGDDIEIFTGSKKHLLAGPRRLLIDDRYENCLHFAMFGGESLLFPRPWNADECKPLESWITVFPKIENWGRHTKTFDGPILDPPTYFGLPKGMVI